MQLTKECPDTSTARKGAPLSKPSLEERSGFNWTLKTNGVAIRVGDEKLAHVVKGIADVCWGAASGLNLSINLIKILADEVKLDAMRLLKLRSFVVLL